DQREERQPAQRQRQGPRQPEQVVMEEPARPRELAEGERHREDDEGCGRRTRDDAARRRTPGEEQPPDHRGDSDPQAPAVEHLVRSYLRSEERRVGREWRYRWSTSRRERK